MIFSKNPVSEYSAGSLDWIFFDNRNSMTTPRITSTPAWPRSLYAPDGQNIFRTICEILYVYLIFSFNYEEVCDYQLVVAAYKSVNPNAPGRRYYTDPWNWLDVWSQFVGTFTLFMYYLIIIPSFNQTVDWPKNPKEVWYGLGWNMGWYGKGFVQPVLSQLFMFFNFIFIGARLFKFFQFHPGVSFPDRLSSICCKF